MGGKLGRKLCGIYAPDVVGQKSLEKKEGRRRQRALYRADGVDGPQEMERN